MDGTTVLLIVLAVVVVLILIAVVMVTTRKAKERRIENDRQRAQALHQEAQAASAHAEKQQAAADEVEARARKAQAVADEKAAEARRLAAGAAERQQAAADARSEVHDRLERANAIDPDRGRDHGDGRTADGTPRAAGWGADMPADDPTGAPRSERSDQSGWADREPGTAGSAQQHRVGEEDAGWGDDRGIDDAGRPEAAAATWSRDEAGDSVHPDSTGRRDDTARLDDMGHRDNTVGPDDMAYRDNTVGPDSTVHRDNTARPDDMAHPDNMSDRQRRTDVDGNDEGSPKHPTHQQ
ncbi:MAG TPA: hypothetical protein VFT31_01675 [Kribbella sp.]|nr:hypothetical protein [Kribbella sp.]